MCGTSEVGRSLVGMALLFSVVAGPIDVRCVAQEADAKTQAKDSSNAPPAAEKRREPLIPSGPRVFTIHDYEKTALPFFEKTLVEAYRKHGMRDPKWDEQAEAFLRAWIRDYIMTPDCLTEVGLSEAGLAVIRLSCEDPLVWGLRAPILANMEGRYVGRTFAQTWLVDAKERGYPTLARVLLAAKADETIKRMRYQDLAELRKQIVLDGIRETLSQKPEKPTDSRPIYAILSEAASTLDGKGLAAVDEVCRAALDRKQGDPWLIRTLLGAVNVRWAWEWRGGGWASEVTDEGWAGFDKHLAIADAQLREANKLHPDRPEPATQMIAIAGAGRAAEGESVFYWFRKAVAAQMDYMPAYSTLEDFIQPKWGGSRSLMYAYGKACVRTQRFDTWVPMRFYTIMRRMNRDDEPWLSTWRLPGVYPVFKELFEGYAKSPELAGRRDWLLSRHAAVAWKSAQHTESLRLLRQLNDEERFYDLEANDMYIAADSMIPEVHARGGPAGPLILKADKADRAENLPQARQYLRQAMKEAGDDDRAKCYIEGRLAGLDVEEGLTTGEWIDLTFDEDLTGWWTERGSFERSNPKTVRARPGTRLYKASMLHFAGVGHRFQFEAEAEVHGNTDNVDSVLIFCHAQEPVFRFHTAVLDPRRGKAAIRRDFYTGEFFPVDADRKKNRIQVTVWDRQVALAINDRIVYRGTWLRPDEVFGAVERIGLGTRINDHKYKVTYRNVRVRGLKERPEVLDEEPDQDPAPDGG